MMSELSAAITSAKALKDTAKFLAEVSKEFPQIELKLKVVELVSQVSHLSHELNDLKQKLSIRESVSYVDGVYWKIGKENSGDPFCSRCLDVDDKLVRMRPHDWNGVVSWDCLGCSTHVIRNDVSAKSHAPSMSVGGVS